MEAALAEAALAEAALAEAALAEAALAEAALADAPLLGAPCANTLILGNATTPPDEGRGTVDGLTTGLGLTAGFEPGAGLGFAAAPDPAGLLAAGVAAGATAGVVDASGADGVRAAGSERVGPLPGVRA